MIEPFNGLFFALLGFIAAFLVLSYFSFRKASERKKKTFIVSIAALTFIGFWIYKGFLSVDTEFMAIDGIDHFNWLTELPLHLCNINMMLIPIGVLFNNRFIKGFSFYTAPLGAFMALIFPEPAFTGYSILLPRNIGYYGTHVFIIILGLLLLVLGFFRPSLRVLPGIVVTFCIVAASAHLVNTAFRVFFLSEANYFYTYGADISILKLCWSLIPVPFLYELPLISILLVYMALFSLPFYFIDRKKAQKETVKQ